MIIFAAREKYVKISNNKIKHYIKNDYRTRKGRRKH